MAKSKSDTPKSEKPKKDEPTRKAPEVQALAETLIAADHPSLATAGIRYGFAAGKGPRRFGKVVLVPEVAQRLLERNVHFLVIVSKSYWDTYRPEERSQALDELLCGCSYDAMKARLEKPDFKGYRANLLRYGTENNANLRDAFHDIQLVLPEMPGELARALRDVPIEDEEPVPVGMEE
jgi:hypothetical protein